MGIRSRIGLFALVSAVAAAAAGCSRPSARPRPSASPSGLPGAPPAIDRVTPLPSPLPEIVARVNGSPVRLQQVLGLAKKALNDSKEREKDTPGAVRQAMHQYVVRELLFQEAMARGISADTRHVEAVYDQVRSAFKDEPRWIQSLADQGLDPTSYKEELRVQETVNALLAKEGQSVVVTDEEAKAFFDSHPRAVDPRETLVLRHIFLRVPPASPERVKETIRVKAAIAAHRAQGGEDFERLVQEFSDDKETKARGGRLEIRPGTMPPAFEAAAYALAPGQASGPVETPAGFSVIKLEQRLPGPPPSFEEVKEAIRQELLARKRQEAYQTLVNSLRAKARIETYL